MIGVLPVALLLAAVLAWSWCLRYSQAHPMHTGPTSPCPGYVQTMGMIFPCQNPECRHTNENDED